MLEVIVTSVAEYAAAVAGGADRVELVSAMEADGLTPDEATLQAICAQVTIPIRVMVRFHNRDFHYTASEVDAICEWIAQHRHLPIDGFVVGALTSNNEIDTHFLQRVAEVAGPIPLTFHRAFDQLSPQAQRAALPILQQYPIDTILTSGGTSQPIAQNLAALAHLQQSAKPLQILVGGGVNQALIAQLKNFANLQAVHVGSAVHPNADFSQPISEALIADIQKQLKKGETQ